MTLGATLLLRALTLLLEQELGVADSDVTGGSVAATAAGSVVESAEGTLRAAGGMSPRRGTRSSVAAWPVNTVEEEEEEEEGAAQVHRGVLVLAVRGLRASAAARLRAGLGAVCDALVAEEGERRDAEARAAAWAEEWSAWEVARRRSHARRALHYRASRGSEGASEEAASAAVSSESQPGEPSSFEATAEDPNGEALPRASTSDAAEPRFLWGLFGQRFLGAPPTPAPQADHEPPRSGSTLGRVEGALHSGAGTSGAPPHGEASPAEPCASSSRAELFSEPGDQEPDEWSAESGPPAAPLTSAAALRVAPPSGLTRADASALLPPPGCQQPQASFSPPPLPPPAPTLLALSLRALASNTQPLLWLALVANHALDASLLSLLPALSVFLYAALEAPRPARCNL